MEQRDNQPLTMTTRLLSTADAFAHKSAHYPQGVARSGFPRAANDQEGSSLPADLPRLLCSLALMRDFAVAVLWRNRDSLSVSTMWQ